MITLLVLNHIANLINSLYAAFFSWAIQPLTNMASTIQTFYVPQTILDVFSLANYFLPMGTISVLFGLTVIMILIKIAAAVLHFLSLDVRGRAIPRLSTT